MAESDVQREFATQVVRKLQDAGFTALWAGGCVRDLLRGHPPKDYDVATTARPEEVRGLFGHRRTLAVGESFGVVIVLGSRKLEPRPQIEVATFRREGRYLDGRRPESVDFCTPQEDARRRDFTINGMFLDPVTDTLHDFVGGREDLERHTVRAIGDPHDRMAEDKLRMLRAVRFAATLQFDLEQDTAAAVREMAAELQVVSVERIAQELRRMLADRHRAAAVSLLRDTGLLPVIFPQLVSKLSEDGSELWEQTRELLRRIPIESFELGLAGLLHSLPSASHRNRDPLPDVHVRTICRRLKLSNSETDTVAWLVDRLDSILKFCGLSLAEQKRLLSHERADLLIALAAANVDARGLQRADVDAADEMLRRSARDWLDPPELIGGEDLKQLGWQPGPRFKTVLAKIRTAQLNEQIHTRAEALALAQSDV